MSSRRSLQERTLYEDGAPSSKRRRTNNVGWRQKHTNDDSTSSSSSSSSKTENSPSSPPTKAQPLPSLCLLKQWTEATQRAMTHPEEADWTVPSNSSTPLALACRKGAPLACIKSILEASPVQVRRSIPSYGTPIHEAIVCDQVGSDTIELLIQADEALGRAHDDANNNNNNNGNNNNCEHNNRNADNNNNNMSTAGRSSSSRNQVGNCDGGAVGGYYDDPPPSCNEGRATLLQDVDGHTPLHLLIRRRFQSHIHGQTTEDDLIVMLRLLVQSAPEAVGISDRGEYEEPPLVMALKASLYAGEYDPDDYLYIRIERRIHEMVRIMLQHNPQAASMVLKGARGHYTALHSAVFHGRCSDTINLLLQAEEKCPIKQECPIHRGEQPNKAALLANSQGELPLHFAAMRGEPPRSFFFLSEAAPKAVLKRDTQGLTPFDWLWIRFVSILLSLDDRSSRAANNNGSNGSSTATAETLVPVQRRRPPPPTTTTTSSSSSTSASGTSTTTTASTSTSSPGYEHNRELNKYSDFCSLERGDFYADLKLIRRLDPPADFLRMRHIPQEFLLREDVHEDDVENENDSTRQPPQDWSKRSIQLLKRIRTRHIQHVQQQQQQQDDPHDGGKEPQDSSSSVATATVPANGADRHMIAWTRIEAVTALFWTKVVSFLRAAHLAEHNMSSTLFAALQEQDIHNNFYLAHAAFASTCCPPPVVEIVSSLFPHELSLADERGRVPLHYAACRSWEYCGNGNSKVSSQEGGSGGGGGGGAGTPSSCRVTFLKDQSLHVLEHAMDVSPPQATRITDKDGRLVLHHAIDTLVRACSNGRSYFSNMAMNSGRRMVSKDANGGYLNPVVGPMLKVLKTLLRKFPDSLVRRDGQTKLYPFLQATAAATTYRSPPSPNGFPVPFPDEMPLSIVYLLLRENPSVVGWACPVESSSNSSSSGNNDMPTEANISK